MRNKNLHRSTKILPQGFHFKGGICGDFSEIEISPESEVKKSDDGAYYKIHENRRKTRRG